LAQAAAASDAPLSRAVGAPSPHERPFHGSEIPADTWVLLAIAGANRDPARIRDPDRFDIDRVQPPDLVFGRGASTTHPQTQLRDTLSCVYCCRIIY
jgi:hypothetical protein